MKNSDAAQIERERHVLAGLEPRRVDRLKAEIERRLGGRQIWREAAFVADIGVVPGLLQRGLKRVKRLRAPAHGFRERRRADRHDHELLKVDRIVGVRAAIDDIHHRRRQDSRHGAADVTVKRQARSFRRGLGDGERHAEDGVGAEPRLVVRAVERDHRLIDLELILGLKPGDGVEKVAIDGLNRFQDALAAEASLVSVAQFDRFARPGGSAGWNGGSSHRAVFQHDIHLDRGIAAAIKDFAADDVDDRSHFLSKAASIGLGSYGIHVTDERRTRGGKMARLHSTFAFAGAHLTKFGQARKNMHGRGA